MRGVGGGGEGRVGEVREGGKEGEGGWRERGSEKRKEEAMERGEAKG